MNIKTLVETYFNNLKWLNEPQNLYAPINYALESGGKRIRPSLVLMAVELFGGNPEEFLEAAAAMEIFHNFTLLHDDIMDNASLRRNRPTVCAKWNANTAILSGDAMLIEAYKKMLSVPTDKLKTALEIFSQTAIEVCEGQQYDSDFEKREDVTEAEYFNMIRLKTAVLLAGSLKLGAVLAGAKEEDANHLYDFGIAIGIAFQLRDDFLDCYGDEKTFGKKIGGDILCGKRTYLLVNAFEKGSVSQKQTIHYLLEAKACAPDEKIRVFLDIYNKLELPGLCNRQMSLYFRQAIESINKIDCSEERKQPLINMAEQLLGRTY